MHLCPDLGPFHFTGDELQRYTFKCAENVLLEVGIGIVPEPFGCKDFHQKLKGRDPQSVIFEMQTSAPPVIAP